MADSFFSLNNSGTNAYHVFMTYIAYFASGVGGVAFVTASYVMTYMRVFDAFTDPMIGFLIDKLNLGKWGKFRPWMAIGNAIMTITLVILINVMSYIPEEFRFLFFVGCYFFYIVGYTCQTACTKAAQSCLTKDPKQRPLLSMFDTFFSMGVIGGYGVFVSMYLIPKHGDYTLELFQEFIIVAVILAIICTILASIGLWGEDVVPPTKEEKVEKAKIIDYIAIMKHNDALRKLMGVAAFDKLAALVATNPTAIIILFALIIGNYGLSGTMTFAVAIPMIIAVSIGTKLCQKYDMRRVVIGFKLLSIVLCSGLILLIAFTDISVGEEGTFGVLLIIFLILYVIEQAVRGFATATFTPMIADCIDYEEFITGKKNPGMIGTMYSLIEKFVSSLSTTVAGIAVALVGFGEVAPTVTTQLTSGLYYAGLFLVLGIPILSAIFTVVQMLRYPLTKEKMIEVQEQISKEV